MSRVTNVVIAGLGGQGVLTASDVLAEAAFRAGLDVKKAEVHGMSQRGGSVSCDVRFGEHVLSPMTPEGEADALVVLEETQVEPNRHCLRKGGILLTPAMIDAAALPSAKALNVAMLGLLSAALPIPDGAWMEGLRASFPSKLHEGNEKAFRIGRSASGAQGGAR
jgi:indolepyruvate ferredoxin oxidoreductase beta subunit